jgi:cytochrome c oxidase subunit III
MKAVIQNNQNKIHPHKLALWIGCGSVTMMFAAWSSAYVVRHAAGNWLEFQIPTQFFINTVLLLLSSVTLHLSYKAFVKGEEFKYKSLLVTTFLIGITFLILQYQGWVALKNIGVPLTKNPSGDFVYVMSGFHAAHLIGGLGVLTVAMVHAFVLKFNPTPRRQLRLELTLHFWHYLDFLWLYLFIFLLSQS